ncbi:PREDICTED: E3 ubiquitin-protein ligase BRE1B-like [Tinamus guttatus]|uniref:E3 ubiquitin-protein ligase BRE1B-like n=1 Tax=Tinamus guttatus TaxID=94827 RepID=UPI00052EDF69|nr:PREDICTED: E3 ubiquitin-protein ligase BRE1B-like [Tinamus guttatus]
MRHLISSLQNHNHQLKGDVQRYKRKLREAQADIAKVPGEFLGVPGGPWRILGAPEDSGRFLGVLEVPGISWGSWGFQEVPGGSWRSQEELSRLRRKLEKQRKVEVYADADQILQEEIKEYRARLTCPCCNARKKDAVLTKCFHVFCFECVRGRYESRQRKCPKCNAAFGAHDFHRVYIS